MSTNDQGRLCSPGYFKHDEKSSNSLHHQGNSGNHRKVTLAKNNHMYLMKMDNLSQHVLFRCF